MSKINLLIFSALFFLFSCEKKKESISAVNENEEKFHKIKSFLGLKKGMTSQNVSDLLDSKSIKHSSLISSLKLKSGDEFNPEQYRKKQIQFMEVFDYPVGSQKLNKFHLFFVNDILFEFSFYRSFYNQTSTKNRKLDSGLLFKAKYGPIVSFINETLIEKYGQPNNYSPNNAMLDTPDLDFDLNLSNSSKEHSSYYVKWKFTNPNEDLTVSIDSHQELEYLDFSKKTSYGCSFHVLVEFSDEKVEKMLKQIEAEEQKINNKIESDNFKKILKSKNDI